MNIHKPGSAPRIGFGTAESRAGRVAVVSVWGDLDALTAPMLARAIRSAAQRQPDALIVDLSAVGFLASAGMSVLVDAHEELRPAVRFRVVADGPSTGRPLALLGIDTLIAVHRTLEAALGDEL